MSDELFLLLSKAEKLFVHKRKPTGPDSYDFILGKFPRGWSFSVVNSWHLWLERGYETNFRIWSTPEAAVNEFLKYVKENKINVAKLMEK